MIRFDCPRELREIIASLVRANVSPIIVSGLSGNILYIHKKYIGILGYDEQDIFNENVVISHPDSFSTNQFIRKSLLSGVIDEMEINKIYQRKNGSFFHAELNIKLFHCKKTSTKLFVSTLRFVERSARDESLYELAFKDMMTGFYNRNYLRMIMDTHNKVDNSTVIYFDIDGLKTINDQYGHAIGDKVIVGFAEHIKRSILYPCTIIRLGGDEFTSIIYDRLSKDILNNLVKSLSSFNIVLPCGSVYSVRVSIGFASVSCLHGFDTAIALADKEMYLNKKRAKSKGD